MIAAGVRSQYRFAYYGKEYEGYAWDDDSSYRGIDKKWHTSYHDREITDYAIPKWTYYLEVYSSWTPVTKKQTTGYYYTVKWQ